MSLESHDNQTVPENVPNIKCFASIFTMSNIIFDFLFASLDKETFLMRHQLLLERLCLLEPILSSNGRHVVAKIKMAELLSLRVH